MGEVAEMMLDGTLCQICGGLMEDLINENGDDLKESPDILELVKIVKNMNRV